jgi:two-component system, response regulator, stage 0 sporulation protein F
MKIWITGTTDMPKILIVEDEEMLRDLYEEELIDEGYEVSKAANGTEALKIVESEEIDLIMMDISMPEMDGIQALGKVASREKKIPVIIYTAYSNYKSNFMTWTADAYLTKSSNLDELKKKINNLLARD